MKQPTQVQMHTNKLYSYHCMTHLLTALSSGASNGGSSRRDRGGSGGRPWPLGRAHPETGSLGNQGVLERGDLLGEGRAGWAQFWGL